MGRSCCCRSAGLPNRSLLLLAASALAAPADDGSSARCTLHDGCPPANGSQWVGVVSSGSLGPVPSLLLIGTRKGGTTSLSKQLLLHPHVLAPNCAYDRSEWPVRAARTTCVWDKEVRYFSRGVGVGLDFCWYRRRYPCASPPHVTFDGSPDYLVMPPEKIALMARSLPAHARLVAMLRNPADRFYSAYNMGMNERLGNPSTRDEQAATGEAAPAKPDAQPRTRRRRGAPHVELRRRQLRGAATYELFAGSSRPLDQVSLPRASEIDPPRSPEIGSLDRWIGCAPDCPDEIGIVSMFFNYGLYARSLRLFALHFGPPVTRAADARPGAERLLLLSSEEFYADSAATLRQVFEFAGLDPLPAAEATSRSPAATGPGTPTHANAGSAWGGSAYLGKLRPEERLKLSRFYAPHNRELYAWVGKDFGWEAAANLSHRD